MASTAEIITAAYRKIGIAATGSPITQEELADGLMALNMMLHGFKLQGVDFAHVDLVAADTFPLDPEYHEGAVYLLAGRLSTDYIVPAAFDAEAWLRRFQAHNTTITAMEMPTIVSLLRGNRRGYY
jgi:hypothetical protein